AEQARDLLRECSGEIGEVLAGLEPLHELGSCGYTDIGANQRLFEPLPGRIVARVERRRGKLRSQRLTTLRERVAQAGEQAGALGLRFRTRAFLAEQLGPATRQA